MKDWLLYWIWRGLPKRVMSRMVGSIAKRPFSRRFIPYYVKLFRIDLEPVKRPVEEFESLLDFFTRELHPDVRPITPTTDLLVSPVDGTVSQAGLIHKGQLIQAKGDQYSLPELLGDEEQAQKFEGGEFLTLYLSPRDYHRIHMPIEGVVTSLTHVPGTLYPVNAQGLRLFPSLFTKNERMISYIHSAFGRVALVKVGATNVGSIKVTFDTEVITNQRGKKALSHKVYNPPHRLLKGEEFGRFEFGSTVILLLEKNSFEWLKPFPIDTEVKMGEPLARMVPLENRSS